jgi:hypothetical protein
MKDHAKTPSRRPAANRISQRVLPRAAFVICVFAILLVPPVAQAGKALTGTISTLPGKEGSAEAPEGVAVNRGGAGGVGVGDVYVVNSPNNRVEAFSATGSFTRAFGYDVAAAGPDNTGVNEKETVTLDATGGSFDLTVASGATGFGDVTQGSNIVTKVSTATGAFEVGNRITGGFIPAGATVTAVGAQSLTLSVSATGTRANRALTAFKTATGIPYNTTHEGLEATLVARLGAGNVAVSGGPGATAPLTVEFTGVRGHNDVPQMTANSTALSGGAHTATIATTIPGGGYEVCSPASHPGDVCKAGSESTVAGAMARPQGVAIDQSNGNLYVTDTNTFEGLHNSRVSVYSATGAFEGSFGWKVNASIPAEQLQFCTAATGCQQGTVGAGSGQFGRIYANLPAVDPNNGHLYVPDDGGPGESNSRIQEFAPVLNGSKEVIGAEFVKSIGWDVVAGGPDQSSEVQRVMVKATGGKFKLSFGADTTGELPFDIAAEALEEALNALPSIGSGGGSIEVSGGPGGEKGVTPYFVRFSGGPLKGTDVALLGTVSAGLSGGNPVSEVKAETYSAVGAGLESCVPARGDICKAGAEGAHIGQFRSDLETPTAVDSHGALYVVNISHTGCNSESPILVQCRVYKFSFPNVGEAVASEFAHAYLSGESGNHVTQAATDVAVDPATDHVLVAKMEGEEGKKFLEFDSSGTLLDSTPSGGTVLKVSPASSFQFHGLAIGTGERFYYSNSLGNVAIFGPPPPPSVAIGPVTGVGATSATFHGTVTPAQGPEGERFDTGYYFEYSVDGANWSRFPAADVNVGDGSAGGASSTCPIPKAGLCNVTQTAFGLQPNAHYQVRLVGTNGSSGTSATESFTTDPAAPSVSGTVAEEVERGSAVLSGFVNPNNQATSYHFEWGTDTSYDNRVPAEVDASAGSGGSVGRVSAPIVGLLAGATYHFRIVATNATGTTPGPDQEFVTLDAPGLPDNRAFEQVSPNDKRPTGQIKSVASAQLEYQVARDGNSTLYPVLNGLADSTTGGNVEYKAQRGSLGWQSIQLSVPSLVPPAEEGLTAGQTGRVIYYSADLSCGFLSSFQPLTTDTPEPGGGVENLYLRNADGSYTLLSTTVPPNHPPAGPFYAFDGASPDCSHVLFESSYRLLPSAPAIASDKFILYEWVNGALRLAGIRPDGSIDSSALAGTGGERGAKVNSMSADGSRVFFTGTSNEGGDSGQRAVFAREEGTVTMDVSQSQTAIPNDNTSEFQMASVDGSHVFFTGRYGLAPNGSSGGSGSCSVGESGSGAGCDLYDYDLASKTLSDLSVDTNPADTGGAGVRGVLDASDDGSYVYFAARGQMVPNLGKTEAQNLLGGGGYNVYLAHGGQLFYVGPISQADMSGHQQAGTDAVAARYSTAFGSQWVADATPDGTHLLFVSHANVTGYLSGGVQEAYLYSAGSGETVCVSCRRDGQPAVPSAPGEEPVEPIASEEQGEEQGGPMGSKPRSLSDDGRRVFFKMHDALAPGAISARRNFYEWEGGQVYLLASGEGGKLDFSKYLGASASGDDVFIRTAAKLVPQDFDNTTDVYDVRAPHTLGEAVGFPPPPPKPSPCDPLADQCQGSPKSPPAQAGGGASENPSGTGNPTIAPRKACRKGKVRRKGRCVKPGKHHDKDHHRRGHAVKHRVAGHSGGSK